MVKLFVSFGDELYPVYWAASPEEASNDAHGYPYALEVSEEEAKFCMDACANFSTAQKLIEEKLNQQNYPKQQG